MSVHKYIIMEKMNDLKDLLKHEIEDLYSVEEQILEALPKMIEKANNPDLKKALNNHLKITEQHKARLDKIQKEFNLKEEKKGFLSSIFSGKQTCKGMQGIIEEGNKIMNADISPEALDAAIIASAQKVEHYEICGYGTAKCFARELGLEQVAAQLEQTLSEEYEADILLTELAEARVNLAAENTQSSASSRGRSAGRPKEKAGREMEMEAVSSSRGRSSGRGTTASSKSSSQKGSNKPSGSSSRSEGSGRSSSSTKRTASNERSSKSSGRSNGRSSSGRGSTNNSRGRR